MGICQNILIMDRCQVCHKQDGNILCSCGKQVFCSTECLEASAHIKECDPKRLDLSLYTSLLVNLLPIIESGENDKELEHLLKQARNHIIDKLHAMK